MRRPVVMAVAVEGEAAFHCGGRNSALAVDSL
jgi:hypothetical protein